MASLEWMQSLSLSYTARTRTVWVRAVGWLAPAAGKSIGGTLGLCTKITPVAALISRGIPLSGPIWQGRGVKETRSQGAAFRCPPCNFFRRSAGVSLRVHILALSTCSRRRRPLPHIPPFHSRVKRNVRARFAACMYRFSCVRTLFLKLPMRSRGAAIHLWWSVGSRRDSQTASSHHSSLQGSRAVSPICGAPFPAPERVNTSAMFHFSN